MPYCGKCGSPLREGAKFCGMCAAPVAIARTNSSIIKTSSDADIPEHRSAAHPAVSTITKETKGSHQSEQRVWSAVAQRAFKAMKIGAAVGLVVMVLLFMWLLANDGDQTPIGPAILIVMAAGIMGAVLGALYGLGFAYGWEDIVKWTLRGTVVAGEISFYYWIKTLIRGNGSENLAKAVMWSMLSIGGGLSIGCLIGMFKGIVALLKERREQKARI